MKKTGKKGINMKKKSPEDNDFLTEFEDMMGEAVYNFLIAENLTEATDRMNESEKFELVFNDDELIRSFAIFVVTRLTHLNRQPNSPVDRESLQ